MIISRANARRRILLARRKEPHYVLFPIEEPLPERDSPRRFPLELLPGITPPLTMERLGAQVQRVIEDPDLRGVVFHIGDLGQVGYARMWSLRRMLENLAQAGKETVVYADTLTPGVLFVASAARRLIMPESGFVLPFGLRAEITFLKDLLDAVGIEFEVVAVSPYKAAADVVSRSDISQEHREMLDWLLDDSYQSLLEGIAAGRGLSVDELKERLDDTPVDAKQAREAGLIDELAYEDALPELLGEGQHKARILTWDEARPLLYWRYRPLPRRHVGIVSLEGLIVPGQSRKPPFPLPLPLVGAGQAGAETLVQTIRGAAENKSVAAVVLHVDSRGGSALASDLIWRALVQLNERKPVVVYMDNVAGSGGYYVAVPGRWIVAQPGTYTGSIGVVIAKPVTRGLFDRLRANRLVLTRGRHATLYTDAVPWSAEERQLVEQQLQLTYARFKQRVQSGRSLSPESLEAVAGGRVWTGRQALEHGLVDELGDIRAAIRKAQELAQLPLDPGLPAVNLTPPKRFLLSVPDGARKLARLLRQERVWLLDPFTVEIKW